MGFESMPKDKLREIQVKGGKRSAKGMPTGFNWYTCSGCNLKCPYKEILLDKDDHHKCIIPEQRYYAQKQGLSEIMTAKVAENKFYSVVAEVERITTLMKEYVQDVSDASKVELYMKQLAFLSKLILDVKQNFENIDEIGSKADPETTIANQKLFLNLVYKIIKEECEETLSKKILKRIHEEAKQ